MDPISDIFRTLQIDALVQSRLEATSPWAVCLAVQPRQATSELPLAHRPGAAYFCMISRGHCWLKVEGEKEPLALAGGDCFLLAPNVSFSLSDLSHTAPVSFCDLRTKAIRNVVHHGGGGAPTTLIWGLLQLKQGSIRPLSALLPKMIVIRSEQTQASGLNITLHLLAAEMALRAPGSDVAANRLAEVLFVQLLRAYITVNSGKRKTGWLSAIFDQQIGAALSAVHADLTAAWTVESIAEAAGMSRSSFAVRFKNLLGETPMQYVAGWRMQKSLSLLERGDAKLSHVSLQVGYETDAAFNKAFKRVIGVTPGQYRNNSQSPTSYAGEPGQSPETESAKSAAPLSSS